MAKPKGFSIRIFLPEGSDGLRIVEKSNWTGLGVMCPRGMFHSAKARPEFSKTGVYLLTGPPSDSGLPLVYVGEGDPVGPRLENHMAKKDFWTSLIFFTSKDENLNKAHAKHLEARLLRIARAAKRCDLDNASQPELPSLSEAEGADVDAFLDEMLLCLPILGLNIFEMPTGLPPEAKLLHLKAKGLEAQGYESREGFVVLAGSKASATEAPSIHRYLSQLRTGLVGNELLRQEGSHLVLSQDYEFGSPSTAAGVMLGRSANGRTSWRDDHGKTLKQLQSG
jgi:hypothetical protein